MSIQINVAGHPVLSIELSIDNFDSIMYEHDFEKSKPKSNMSLLET